MMLTLCFHHAKAFTPLVNPVRRAGRSSHPTHSGHVGGQAPPRKGRGEIVPAHCDPRQEAAPLRVSRLRKRAAPLRIPWRSS